MKKSLIFLTLLLSVLCFLTGCGNKAPKLWEAQPEEAYAAFMEEKAKELNDIVSAMTSVYETQKGTAQKKIQKNEIYKTSYNAASNWFENINAYSAVPFYAAELHASLVSYAKSCLSFIASVPSYTESGSSLKVSDTITILNAEYETIKEEIALIEVLSTPAAEIAVSDLSGKWRASDKSVLEFKADKLICDKEEHEGSFDAGRFISNDIQIIITSADKNKIEFIRVDKKTPVTMEAFLIQNKKLNLNDCLNDYDDFDLTFCGVRYDTKLVPGNADNSIGYPYYEISKEDQRYFIAEFILKNTSVSEIGNEVLKDISFSISYMDKLSYEATKVFEKPDGTGFIGNPSLSTAQECKLYARFSVPDTLLSETCTLHVSLGNYIYTYEYIPEVGLQETTETEEPIADDAFSENGL